MTKKKFSHRDIALEIEEAMDFNKAKSEIERHAQNKHNRGPQAYKDVKPALKFELKKIAEINGYRKLEEQFLFQQIEGIKPKKMTKSWELFFEGIHNYREDFVTLYQSILDASYIEEFEKCSDKSIPMATHCSSLIRYKNKEMGAKDMGGMVAHLISAVSFAHRLSSEDCTQSNAETISLLLQVMCLYEDKFRDVLFQVLEAVLDGYKNEKFFYKDAIKHLSEEFLCPWERGDYDNLYYRFLKLVVNNDIELPELKNFDQMVLVRRKFLEKRYQMVTGPSTQFHRDIVLGLQKSTALYELHLLQPWLVQTELLETYDRFFKYCKQKCNKEMVGREEKLSYVLTDEAPEENEQFSKKNMLQNRSEFPTRQSVKEKRRADKHHYHFFAAEIKQVVSELKPEGKGALPSL